MKLGLAGGSYVSQSINVDDSDTINFYPETVESGRGKANIVLYPTPGLLSFSTLDPGPIRGMLALNDRLIVVSGDIVYEVDSAGTGVNTGYINNDTKPVSLAANRTQVLIVSGGEGYILEGGATTLIASVDFPHGIALTAGFTDGYFLVLASDDRFYISGINNGTAWDASEYGEVLSSANDLVSMLVDHREVWIFGNQIAQVFFDSGNADFPFDAISSGVIMQGCAAPHSPVRLDNSVFWLGSDERGAGVVWRAQGYVPQRVSNHAVEFAIQQYSAVSDAVGFSYQDQGHSFYVLYFPSGNETWCFDSATNMWHKRLYWNQTNGAYEAHRAAYHAFCFGRHIVGDRSLGRLYLQSINYYDDAGDIIRRLRRATHLADEQKRIVHHYLQLDLQPGIGLNSGQGSNPLVMLRWSNDGGHTWSNVHTESAGLIGQYTRRVIWRRLGIARDRVYEVSMTDPVPWRLIDCYLSLEKWVN